MPTGIEKYEWSSTVEFGVSLTSPTRLHLRSLRDLERVANLNPEVSDGALKFAVPEEKFEPLGDFWSAGRSASA